MADKNLQDSWCEQDLYTTAELIDAESIDAIIRLEAVKTVKAGHMLRQTLKTKVVFTTDRRGNHV